MNSGRESPYFLRAFACMQLRASEGDWKPQNTCVEDERIGTLISRLHPWVTASTINIKRPSLEMVEFFPQYVYVSGVSNPVCTREDVDTHFRLIGSFHDSNGVSSPEYRTFRRNPSAKVSAG